MYRNWEKEEEKRIEYRDRRSCGISSNMHIHRDSRGKSIDGK